MRLRVKSSSGGLQRLELQGESPSLAEAQAAVAQAFHLPSDVIVLSFNNKDPLAGDAGSSLRELGVRSGDLLWLLSPAPPPPPAAPQTVAAAALPAWAEAGGKRIRNSDEPALGEPAAQQQQQQQQQIADKGKQAAPAGDGDGAEPMAVEHEGEEPLEPQPPSQRLPAHLLRTLQASCTAASQAADVLLLAAHGAMLETGFVPRWPAGGDSSSGSSVYAVPRSCWASASLCRIQYTLQPANGEGSSSGSEEMEATGAAGQAGEPAAGAEAQAVAGPACTLQCSSMGGGAVVLAVATQGHARHLALQAATFVQPLEAAAAGAGPSSSGGAPAAGEAAGPAGQGAAGAVQLLPDGGLALGGRLQLGAAAAKQLWTRLKDGLAFPMLLAAYAEAGLAPPAGLLALPEELKQRVLEALGPCDLAALCCTCCELRHLASQDALWRPLFEKEFPRAVQFYVVQARTRGYKWAFGQAWRERRQREDALRRARTRSFMPAVPRFGVPRPPPFYPAPPPGHHPFIIGGDYDRLPQFGPNGGGLPGQLGGGHMFGGVGGPGGVPSPFLGGSRRQGGRGSSGGFRMY